MSRDPNPPAKLSFLALSLQHLLLHNRLELTHFLRLPRQDEELPLLPTDHTSKKGTPHWLAFALKTVVRQLLPFQ